MNWLYLQLACKYSHLSKTKKALLVSRAFSVIKSITVDYCIKYNSAFRFALPFSSRTSFSTSKVNFLGA